MLATRLASECFDLTRPCSNRDSARYRPSAKGFRMSTSPHGLQKVLGPVQLWGIAVGLVISGEYFGWSYGWNTAGTLGFLVSTVLVATMYTTFIFSFTELSTAIPHAVGPKARLA